MQIMRRIFFSVAVLCSMGMMCSSAEAFSISVGDVVDEYNIYGVTFFMDVSDDFSLSNYTRGDAVNTDIWDDEPPGYQEQYFKLGTNSFFAAMGGEPDYQLKPGQIFSFDYTGEIYDFVKIEFVDFDTGEDYYESGKIVMSGWDGDSATFSAPVPIPPAIFLFASGLCAMVAIRRKNMQ